ncbi:MAG: flagellar motor switch protein FliM [Desulfobacterales bacterium]|nr:flagellar motor switch protein FliM [Desulfobacterales bacterium]MDJ0886224.1 flagellar motor switch protein FliM [Desulfobacterales bacterium]MDJ0990386.1 flagellar motor switch protein FliM [Desulfobacterales bacterium]
MADNVLSQDEIDALLSAMDSGEVDLQVEEEPPEARAESYDLTSQNIMLRDQFSALEEVYDKYSGLLQNSLAALLQQTLEVKFVSTEMVKFGDFIQAFSNPTSFTIYTMDPLIGSALLAIEPSLVFSMIDCMFGGKGTPFKQRREFTMIENGMLQRLSRELLGDFERAWERVFSIRITPKKSETKPEFVHMVSPDELMIVIVFSISSDEFSGNFHICMSYRMLEPIKDKLSSRYLRAKDAEHAFSDRIQKILEKTDVELIAELGHTDHTFGDLLSLQENDIFTLNTGPHDPITVNIESVPKYRGFPGIINGNRAVELTETIIPEKIASENE